MPNATYRPGQPPAARLLGPTWALDAALRVYLSDHGASIAGWDFTRDGATRGYHLAPATYASGTVIVRYVVGTLRFREAWGDTRDTSKDALMLTALTVLHTRLVADGWTVDLLPDVAHASHYQPRLLVSGAPPEGVQA